MYFVILFLAFFLLAYVFFPHTVRSITQPFLGIYWQSRNIPILTYQTDSVYCKKVVDLCKILTERYSPPLWGYVGHIQTMLFSVKGPMDSSTAKSKRVKLPVSDGSTVSYDIFEPAEGPVEDVVLFMLPGINNSSESDYMQSFAANATKNGYRCAIFNYIGILNEPISGNRVFTYGGTGDVYLMYQDLLSRYGHNVKFAGIGYSMGACVLLRFLGERDEFQRKFVCAFSFCQGYSPLDKKSRASSSSKVTLRMKLLRFVRAMPFLNSLVEVRKFYDFVITRRMVRLIKRHREKLFGEERVDPNGLVIPPSLVDEGRDMNGFPLSGRVKISPDTRLWTSNTIVEFDEYYTRRIMGFDTPIDVYKWASCKSFLTKPSILPIVIVNALDDPVIPNILHNIASEYVLKYNPNAIFIQTQHGGHLAYYEGGVVAPNKRSWLDRLIFEYIPISIKHWNTSNVFKNQ